VHDPELPDVGPKYRVSRLLGRGGRLAEIAAEARRLGDERWSEARRLGFVP
jgi:hypothetical protein